jgi:uncharacterized protein with GYD domain
MTFLDPRAMIECRLVSKYWNHHANKPNVEKEVREQAKQRYTTASVSTINDSRKRVREVFDELNRKGLEITDQVIEGAISEAPTDDTFFFSVLQLSLANTGQSCLLPALFCSTISLPTRTGRPPTQRKSMS